MLHGPAESYILSLSCVSVHSVSSLRALLHFCRPSTQSGPLSGMLAGHWGWWYVSVWSINHRKMILVWHCCSAGLHRCWVSGRAVSLIFSILFSIILSDIFYHFALPFLNCVIALFHWAFLRFSPEITVTSEVSSSLFLFFPLLCPSQAHTCMHGLAHALIPLSSPLFSKCRVLQSSSVPREQQSSHQADYALSINLSALFVPADHTASARANPLFVHASVIYSNQNYTQHHKGLWAVTRKNTKKTELFGLLQICCLRHTE